MTDDRPTTDDRPVAAIWRQQWLPRSETFIRDHVTSLQRYQPLTLGISTVPDGLGFVPDRAPLPSSGPLRRLEGLSRRTGWLGLHDDVILRRRPALLHAHFGTDAVRALPLVKRHRLPFAVTFHGYDVHTAPQKLPAAAYRDRLGELFDRADLLLPVSHFLAGMLADLGAPAEKVHVHHLGTPVAGREAPARGERSGIVMVGRFVEYKGFGDLFDILARLPEHLRSTPVTLVGGGVLEARLREQAAAHPEFDVRFAGWQSPDEVAATLARAQVFLSPVRGGVGTPVEAFGLVQIEAALAGLPVVTSRTGGLPEAVAEGVTGLLAEPGDLDGFAAHLASLLDDPERARTMGAAGRARVLADFDVVKQTAKLEALYDTIAR